MKKLICLCAFAFVVFSCREDLPKKAVPKPIAGAKMPKLMECRKLSARRE